MKARKNAKIYAKKREKKLTKVQAIQGSAEQKNTDTRFSQHGDSAQVHTCVWSLRAFCVVSRRVSRIFATLCLVSVVVLPPAYAEANYFTRSGEKLGRGATNVIFSPMAAARAIERDLERDQLYRLLLVTPLEGAARTMGRMVVGIYEMATFWVPQEPILTPTYQTPSIPEYFDEGRRPDLGRFASREGKTIEDEWGGFSV